MKPIMTIQRIAQLDCTVGILNYKNFRCETLELPYLGNQNNISCIPHGLYECQKINSPAHGLCIEIKDVINRTLIRIHPGNYTRQILGCILVGDSLKDIDRDGILDVTNSVNTLKSLMAILPDVFLLDIK